MQYSLVRLKCSRACSPSALYVFNICPIEELLRMRVWLYISVTVLLSMQPTHDVVHAQQTVIQTTMKQTSDLHLRFSCRLCSKMQYWYNSYCTGRSTEQCYNVATASVVQRRLILFSTTQFKVRVQEDQVVICINRNAAFTCRNIDVYSHVFSEKTADLQLVVLKIGANLQHVLTVSQFLFQYFVTF